MTTEQPIAPRRTPIMRLSPALLEVDHLDDQSPKEADMRGILYIVLQRTPSSSFNISVPSIMHSTVSVFAQWLFEGLQGETLCS